MRTVILVRILVLAACASTVSHAAESIRLEALDTSLMHQGYGRPQAGKCVTGKALVLGGKAYEHGLGSHAVATAWYDLGGSAERFTARVGVDDNAGGPGTVEFVVSDDGRVLWRSGVMKPGDVPKAVDVALAGVRYLKLEANDGGDGNSFDHADWVDAVIVMTTGKPVAVTDPEDSPVILTPKPGPAPRINGPLVYGARPGNPFLYRIPCQGTRPITFSADGLPASLKLDSATGIITGTTPVAGEHKVTLHARNPQGTHARAFRIVAGETLALTPPMGWNHWYTHYDRITDKLMREAADVMISSGMADVGYQYVNIDDCWMNAPKHMDPLRVGPARDEQGRLLANKYFPDMKGLADYIHGKGLKAGLYTSPGRLTCGGFAGSYGHEQQDAALFAAWGYDFLKHDWCSYAGIAANGDPAAPGVPNWSKGGDKLPVLKYPYQIMGDALRKQPRDIVLNHCQYGMGNVWEWGKGVGGHCWRTAGDLGFELDRITDVAINNAKYRAWNGPGGWNDPDYLQIGHIGNASNMGEPKPCPLTPNQQYTYMSLWALSAAPLFFSGDMGKLDAFTLNVLCNPEVIDINQDPLGQCGEVVILNSKTFLMIKDLENGDKAVGLFNRSDKAEDVPVDRTVLGMTGRLKARDLWSQRDIGMFNSHFSHPVPPRGVKMLRLTPARQGE